MSTIRKILVPTDFSAYSDGALESAGSIAKKFKAKIILMHVVEPFPYAVTISLTVINQGKALTAIAQSLLENSCKRFRGGDLAIETHLTSGTPYREIVRKAEQDRVDMIVMGTHGRTGMERFLIGSVAEKVIRRAPCSVMTVRSLPGIRKKGRRTRPRRASAK